MISKKAIYQTIYDDIVCKISNGDYREGDLLPSENELEKLFLASRTPVRHALKQLENDGYIFRLQGKGSFVANRRPVGMWTMMTGFENQYAVDWKKISARTIEVSSKKNPINALKLNMSIRDELLHLKRIRSFNGEPVVYLEHYLPPIFPKEMFTKDPTAISVGQMLKDELNIDLVQVKEEIEAVSNEKIPSSYLQVPDSFPLLKITRLSFGNDHTPIDLNVYYVRTDKWKYVVQFNGKGSGS